MLKSVYWIFTTLLVEFVMRPICLIITVVFCAMQMTTEGLAQDNGAYYPDGTIVLSNKRGLVGMIARRITGGDQYTHSGIVLNNRVYESDFPRVRSTPVSRYGKRRTTNDYFVPAVPYTPHQVHAMRDVAQSRLGQPYRLRSYFNPSVVTPSGTWCSPYVGQVLNASGRFGLSSYDMHEPQNILNRVGDSYIFHSRVTR